MNRLCAILSLTFNLALGQNQPLTGRYISNDNYVVITDSSLEFMTGYGCCLLIDLYGFGKYQFHNDSVYVTTSKPAPGHGSTYQVLGDLPTSDQISVKVQNNGQPIQSCYVTLDDKSVNEITHGASTDASGLALLNSLPTDKSVNKIVSIYSLGYDRFEIPLNDITGKSILVDLSDYQVLRDTQVAFKLLVDSNSTKLIGPFFPLTKEKKKELKKEKRKRKGQMMVHSWPWQWRFKDTHVVTPTEYVRQ
ncbi:MAG: hypothetical protein POELPBGB_01605 [Bacteroidia bacterium]|nr:hypothetical protein [Bacteroidia bacterium]